MLFIGAVELWHGLPLTVEAAPEQKNVEQFPLISLQIHISAIQIVTGRVPFLPFVGACLSC